MGQIVVAANLKGGTGKSTIAVNLACALRTGGRSVILLDLDPQGTAVDWAARGQLPIEVIGEPPIDLHGHGRWTKRAVDLARRFEIVMLDLPPLVGRILSSGMMIADLVLVPVTPSPLDVRPTADVLRQIRMARESRQGRPKAFLVPNRVDHEGHYDEATQAAVDGLKERWAPALRRHTDFVNAFAAGQWVGDYAPQGRAVRDIAALEAAVVLRLELAPVEAAPEVRIPA